MTKGQDLPLSWVRGTYPKSALAVDRGSGARPSGSSASRCPSAALRHSSDFHSARAAPDAHISASAEKSQFPFGLQALRSRQAGRRRGPFMGGCVDSSDSLRLKPTNK
jgi:hypothetical protein